MSAARIDHAEHARKRALTLRPAELILFGNPEIGTWLMQHRRISVIDLPTKALAWEDEQGQVRIAHDSMAWLKRRGGLTNQAALQSIDAVLAKLRAGVCGDSLASLLQPADTDQGLARRHKVASESHMR